MCKDLNDCIKQSCGLFGGADLAAATLIFAAGENANESGHRHQKNGYPIGCPFFLYHPMVFMKLWEALYASVQLSSAISIG